MSVDKYQRLVDAVRAVPDVDKWAADPAALHGSGMDHAVARAFVEYRNNLLAIVKENA